MLLLLASINKSNNGFVDQRMDDNNDLDIFQMTIGNIELAKELVKI
jgi:hypothetical protein